MKSIRSSKTITRMPDQVIIDVGVHPASESAVGHLQKSGTAPATSAPGEKQKFPIFIQRSVAGDQLDAA